MPRESEQTSELTHKDVAVIAHEVRGALTVISGFSELLRRELSADDRSAALDGISRAVRRIDRLVDSFLGVGVAAGGQRVALAPLAQAVVAEQRAITGREVGLHIDSNSHVSGTPEALERALGNLIDNALKYSLVNSTVEVSVAEDAGEAVVAVADRGPGIPEDSRDRVLEPFERLDEGDVPGTGLGLAVVAEVAEMHGGRLEITEREGGGAVVSLRLPLIP